jgi:site-specific DNA recombinase
MKAVIYARVSSQEQEKEGYSIPAQLKLLNDYALKNSYKVVKEYKDAETAKKAGREHFGKMVEFLKCNDDVKVVLCEKTDRLYRNFKDYVTFDDIDLEIHFVKEGEILSKDSKSHQKFIHVIKVLMAKNYIDNLSEEVKKGMVEKARNGIFPSVAPLGYKNCSEKNQNSIVKYIVVDKERAPIIERLYRLYATRSHSLSSLANLAYEEGLRSIKGSKLPKSSIENILKNPIYYGDFRWDGKIWHGTHEPIVSKELFDDTQDAFNAHNRPLQTKRGFPYTGLLTCSKCGCSITAEIKKNRYVYYHCTGFRGKCRKGYVREEELGDKLVDIIKAIHIDKEMLELVKTALLDSHKDEIEFHAKQILVLNTQKNRLEHRLHAIYIDKLDGRLSEEQYERMVNEWHKELNQINLKINRHESSDINYITQGVRILELCNNIQGLYLQQTHAERAKLLKTILSNCLFDGVSLYPTYNKPFDLIAKGLSCPNWYPALDSNQRLTP